MEQTACPLSQVSLINADVPEPTVSFQLQDNWFIGWYLVQSRSQILHVMNSEAIHSMNNVTRVQFPRTPLDTFGHCGYDNAIRSPSIWIETPQFFSIIHSYYSESPDRILRRADDVFYA